MGAEEVGTILRKIWPYLLVGIGLGAVIHGWAPEDLFTRYAGPGNRLRSPGRGRSSASRSTPTPPASCPWSRPCYAKGLPMGTLLAFMMAVVALSLPEMILLRRVLKPQLLADLRRRRRRLDRRGRLPVQLPAHLSADDPREGKPP